MSYASQDSATKQTQGDAITPEDITASGAVASETAANYALMLADDALILAQRLGWWISRAPEMEEDIALGNIALDLVGHARFLYSYAGSAWGKTEDDLAYFRDEEEFRSAAIVEQENGDFGQTIARQLIVSYYMYGLYTALEQSQDDTMLQSPRRLSRNSSTTSTTPTSGHCVSASALRSRTAASAKASTTCGRTSVSFLKTFRYTLTPQKPASECCLRRCARNSIPGLPPCWIGLRSASRTCRRP